MCACVCRPGDLVHLAQALDVCGAGAARVVRPPSSWRAAFWRAVWQHAGSMSSRQLAQLVLGAGRAQLNIGARVSRKQYQEQLLPCYKPASPIYYHDLSEPIQGGFTL